MNQNRLYLKITIVLLSFSAVSFFGFEDCCGMRADVEEALVEGSIRNLTLHPPIRINSDAEFTSRFADRTIKGLEINGTNQGYCIFIGNCSLPWKIEDCKLHHASGKSMTALFNNVGIYLYKSSNGTVLSNNISYNENNGIRMEECGAGNVIAKNSLFGNKGSAVYISNCAGTGISFNFMSGEGTALYGLHITQTGRNIIYGNTCVYFKEYGFYIQGSSKNNISGNTARNNNMVGIYFTYLSNSTFWDNNAISNGMDGFYCRSSDNNTFARNNMSGNGRDGMRVRAAYYNTVIYNTFYNNRFCALNLTKYTVYVNLGTVVHHNNFMYNNGGASQCNDETGGNFWNDTAGRGNYWSDHTGPDADSNGIVDVPYLIRGGKNAKDEHPLASPSDGAEPIIPEYEPTFLLPTTITLAAVAVCLNIFVRRRRR